MTREVTCPACGLVVAAGYPRCPRCRALLPGMIAPPAAVAASRGAAGGTAIADRRRPILLIVASVIAVVVAVVAVIILMRDDGERAGAPAPAPSPGLAPAPTPGAEPAAAGEPAAEQGVAVAGPSAASLGAELDVRRLWATVDVDGRAAVIHSAYCADPGMDQAIAAAAADLGAAGIGSVRCHERHGPLVFERSLVAPAPEQAPAPVSAIDAGA